MSTIAPEEVPERLAALGASGRPAVQHRRARSPFVLALLFGVSALCRASMLEDDPLPGFQFGRFDGDALLSGRVSANAPIESREDKINGLKVWVHRYGGSDPRIVLVCSRNTLFPDIDLNSIRIDNGANLFLGDLSVEVVEGSLLVKAGWRKGVTPVVGTFVCREFQDITEIDREELPDGGNLAFGGSARVYYTPLDPQRDVFDRIVSQEYDGTFFGPVVTHVPADPGLFRNELVVQHDPMTNVDVVSFIEGSFPFDGTSRTMIATIDGELVGEAVDLSSSFPTLATEPRLASTGSGFGLVTATHQSTPGAPFQTTGRRFEISQGFRFSRFGAALRFGAGASAEAGLHTAILGQVPGASYRSARLAPAGHDSVIVVGLATEPPRFVPTVKARLVHGDDTSGAVATLELPPALYPVTAIPVTGYRNELYVSLDDTELPDEESGLYRLPFVLSYPPCQADDTTLCLNGGRFKVELAWRDEDGRGGAGHAKPLTGDTGTFWIFDPNNLETVVKVLDAQILNDHFWIFAAGLTNLGIGITVTDTETGHFATFFNTLGKAFAPYQNTQALPGDNLPAEVGWMDRFAAPAGDRPSATASSSAVHRPRGVIHARSSRGSTAACVASATNLCLAGGRFEVSATFETAQGQSGAAQTVGITADTGYLWFFDQDNVEVLVKVLDACVINQRIWVFAGGLTDVKVVLTVRDSVTGQVRTYTNPLGTPFQPIQDTGAFATCS